MVLLYGGGYCPSWSLNLVHLSVFKVALIVHLSLRTAPLQRLVLFDRTPSLAYAPPAHLCTLRASSDSRSDLPVRATHQQSNWCCMDGGGYCPSWSLNLCLNLCTLSARPPHDDGPDTELLSLHKRWMELEDDVDCVHNRVAVKLVILADSRQKDAPSVRDRLPFSLSLI